MTRWQKVKAMAAALGGDGCTASPDLFYTRCCDEHDIHYRTGATIEGEPITRARADARLRECMIHAGRTPIVGRWLLPWFYWAAVRTCGRGHWLKRAAPNGGGSSLPRSLPPGVSTAQSVPTSGIITND